MLSYLYALVGQYDHAKRLNNLIISYDSPMLSSTLGVSISKLVTLGFEGVRDQMVLSQNGASKIPKRNLAYASFFSGDYENSVACFNELDNLAEKDWAFFARALRIIGEASEARKALQQGIERVPNSLTFIVELASLETRLAAEK
jgi:tetratricopeptide (TPR) repeat protein